MLAYKDPIAPPPAGPLGDDVAVSVGAAASKRKNDGLSLEERRRLERKEKAPTVAAKAAPEARAERAEKGGKAGKAEKRPEFVADRGDRKAVDPRAKAMGWDKQRAAQQRQQTVVIAGLVIILLCLAFAWTQGFFSSGVTDTTSIEYLKSNARMVRGFGVQPYYFAEKKYPPSPEVVLQTLKSRNVVLTNAYNLGEPQRIVGKGKGKAGDIVYESDGKTFRITAYDKDGKVVTQDGQEFVVTDKGEFPIVEGK